jgi:NhaA family Na+:H+ antiporter
MNDNARARRRTVPVLSSFVMEHLLLLPLGGLIALTWANTLPESYFSFTYAIAFAVNDVAMVFFFALMTKEVVEATAPNGVLHPWRRALMPFAAAVGATAVAALLYVRAVTALDEPRLAIGWPVTLATDLAVSYFVARVALGRHPAIPFLLLLAIASDALGFLALAVYHPAADVHLARGGIVMIVAMAVALGLRRARVRSFWPYLIAAGGTSWWALYWSGLHPALAMVPIMPFLPHGARDPGFFVDARPQAADTLSRFEVWWRYPAQISLFFFGLVNAGVRLQALEQGTWGLPLAVIIGKPIGLFVGLGVAIAIGLHLPRGVGWRELIVVGFASAIGFSVGLFFCAALLAAGQLRSEISMGALSTLVAAPLAILSARVLHIGRFAREGPANRGV